MRAIACTRCPSIIIKGVPKAQSWLRAIALNVSSKAINFRDCKSTTRFLYSKFRCKLWALTKLFLVVKVKRKTTINWSDNGR